MYACASWLFTHNCEIGFTRDTVILDLIRQPTSLTSLNSRENLQCNVYTFNLYVNGVPGNETNSACREILQNPNFAKMKPSITLITRFTV